MFRAILGGVGFFGIFRPKLSGGGSAFSALLRILGRNFFVGPVTFRKIQIFKKKFFWPEVDPLSRCEIQFVMIDVIELFCLVGCGGVSK